MAPRGIVPYRKGGIEEEHSLVRPSRKVGLPYLRIWGEAAVFPVQLLEYDGEGLGKVPFHFRAECHPVGHGHSPYRIVIGILADDYRFRREVGALPEGRKKVFPIRVDLRILPSQEPFYSFSPFGPHQPSHYLPPGVLFLFFLHTVQSLWLLSP